jgi:uncharacterized membrane protein
MDMNWHQDKLIGFSPYSSPEMGLDSGNQALMQNRFVKLYRTRAGMPFLLKLSSFLRTNQPLMSAVILLLILVLIIFLVLLLNIQARASENQQSLNRVNEKLNKVSEDLYELTLELRKEKVEEKIPRAGKEEISPAVPAARPAAPVIPPSVPEIKDSSLSEAYAEYGQQKASTAAADEEFPEEIDERKFTEYEKKPSRQRNADLERFIGENLTNKIGIAVLVLGIAFFVKYAIDKDWINETGRVIIGLVSGGILIGLAHYIRNNYRSFSSVLVGGGLTVFYFTIAFAFHQYHLMGQQAAFIIMVVISAFAVLLSLYYNRQELAILATIGGFITPFLVTTGQENYIALFTYLCILNTALMVLSWFKRWPAINSIALFFTTIIYGGWLIKRTVFSDSLPYQDAFLFATLFYILFVAMNSINSLRLKRKFTAFDFIIVLSTNFLYYTAGMVILSYNTGNDYQGLFTALLGIANLLLTVVFYRNRSIDRNFISLLTGISLTFISLTAPVQFSGNHIVLFWAAESVVLFWLYQRSRIVHLRVASVIVAFLMLLSLLVVWSEVYLFDNDIIPVIVNKGCITTLAASVALFIYYSLLRREPDASQEKGNTNRLTKNAFLITAILIAYLAGVWEIYYQFSTRFPHTEVSVVYFQVWSFAAAILLLQVFKRSAAFPLLKFLLTGLCLGIYLFNLGASYRVSINLLAGDNGILFAGHWVAVVCLLWLLYSLTRYFFENNSDQWSAYRAFFTWTATISILLLLSIEMYHVILWGTYRNETDQAWWENLYYKAGLTILWSICSFVMMWLGMRFSFRTLRVISLSLFTLTLVKLFSYDIRNIPPGGKIAAFILLGILLLTVSFMYQRLKKIIIDDQAD